MSSEERTKESTAHLMSLLGTSVQIAAPTPKNQRQQPQRPEPAQQQALHQSKPGQGPLEEGDDVLFVENLTSSALPVFTMPLGSDDQAFAARTVPSSSSSIQPSHSRALSSRADQCTLLPDT
eukprot:5194067-Amphidinium_carterae.1